MRRWTVRLVATAVLLLVVAGCDWTQSGMNAGHSLFDPNEPALTASTVGTLSQKFSLSVPNTTNAAPIVAGGRMFFTTFDSSTSTAELHAFDAATGAVVWTTTLATDATGAPDFAYDSGTIYTVGGTASGATVNALASDTGAIQWSVALPAGFTVTSSLVAANGKVFVSMWHPDATFPQWGSLEVLALNGATGATAWTFGGQGLTAPGPNAVPAVGAGYVAVSYSAEAGPGRPTGIPITDVVREADGSLVFSTLNAATSNGALFTMATEANGLLYGTVNAPNQGDLITAFDPGPNGGEWDASGPLGPFAVNGSSYITTDTSGLTALDAKTGASQWTTSWPAGSNSVGGPVIAGNLVYVVTSDGTTHALRTYDAATGAAVSSLDVPSNATTPIVANGFIYFADGGTITAYAPA